MSLNSALCNLTFQCTAPADRDATFVTDNGTSVAECNSIHDMNCATAMTDCPVYTPSAGAQCIAAFQAATCDTYVSLVLVPPTSCQTACP